MILLKSCIFPNTIPQNLYKNAEQNFLFFDIETTGLSWRTSHLYLIGCAYYETYSISRGTQDCSDCEYSADTQNFANRRGCKSSADIQDSADNCDEDSGEGRWVLRQWFLDRPGEEKQLLEAFSDFLDTFALSEEKTSPKNEHSPVLVHYNGSGFDLPYLRHKYEYFGLPDPFASLESLDLFRTIRPYQRLLQLDSLRQKALETALGLPRRDPYSGGELIDVYAQYMRSGEKTLLDHLLLHNFEDVQNLLPLYAITLYDDLFSGNYEICSLEMKKDENGQDILQAVLTLSDALPKELSASFVPEADELPLAAAPVCELPLTAAPVSELPLAAVPVNGLDSGEKTAGDGAAWRLCAAGSTAVLSIPVLRGELYHFFPDYRNYFYLPDEDMAVHKSVGVFVDAAHRRRATADTCYQRITGRFLPQLSECFTPVLRRARRSKLTWFRLEDFPLDPSSDSVKTCLLQLIKMLL